MCIDGDTKFSLTYRRTAFTVCTVLIPDKGIMQDQNKSCLPFDAHCWRMGTATKHRMPDRVKPAFVIFDIQALLRSGLRLQIQNPKVK